MWNTKSDTTGWNIDKETPTKTECNWCKEERKCSMSTLLHCDYREDGMCTLIRGIEPAFDGGVK